jgi:hypothetical protein
MENMFNKFRACFTLYSIQVRHYSVDFEIVSKHSVLESLIFDH